MLKLTLSTIVFILFFNSYSDTNLDHILIDKFSEDLITAPENVSGMGTETHLNTVSLQAQLDQGVTLYVLKEDLSSELSGSPNLLYDFGLNINFEKQDSKTLSIKIETPSRLIKGLQSLTTDKLLAGLFGVSREEMAMIQAQLAAAAQQEPYSHTSELQSNIALDMDINIKSSAFSLATGINQSSESILVAIPITEKFSIYTGVTQRVDRLYIQVQRFQLSCNANINIGASVTLDEQSLYDNDYHKDFDCTEPMGLSNYDINAYHEGQWEYTMAILGVGYKSDTAEFKLIMELDILDNDVKYSSTQLEAIDEYSEKPRDYLNFQLVGNKCSENKGFCLSSSLKALTLNNIDYSDLEALLKMDLKLDRVSASVEQQFTRHLFTSIKQESIKMQFPLNDGSQLEVNMGSLALTAYSPKLKITDAEKLFDKLDGPDNPHATFYDFSLNQVPKTENTTEFNILGLSYLKRRSQIGIQLYREQDSHKMGYTFNYGKTLSQNKSQKSYLGFDYTDIKTQDFNTTSARVSFFLQF
ncbi:MAG: hypothetical protein HOO06_06615 [Bdellovibrionaceae bacterium]|nr:hypothetical protein [Pseudobdellovibrionaceae bacterium]